METALLAAYLYSQQPFQVRHRLLQDEVCAARFALISRRVFTIESAVRIDQQELFAATRQALINKQLVPLQDLDGHEVIVKIDQGQVWVESPSQGKKTPLDDFMILSPHQKERTQALRNLIYALGPTGPDFSELLTQAMGRILNDEEVRALFTACTRSVVAYQEKARFAFDFNQITIENLIPPSLAYFDRFCGPDPKGADPETYLGTILPQYRKDLMRHNLVRGLDICLQGALRDDLMPGAWTENFGDDELWEALTACNPRRDPFVLLGALDIALTRQHDTRYQAFAEQAVQQLTQEELPGPDGVETYELLSLFAETVLNCLNTLEGAALRPPYWKRLCAWMQAGFLCHLTQRHGLELARFRGWIESKQTMAGIYATMLDLRHEPMYHATATSREALRGEIVGRLLQMRGRYQAVGQMIPGADRIDEAMDRLKERGSPLGCALPGPLEGQRRPGMSGRRELPEDYRKGLEEELGHHPPTSVLSYLAYLSQLFDLDEGLLTRMREVLGRVRTGAETNLTVQIDECAEAGAVACAHRDGELANAIATTVVAIAQETQTEHDVTGILQALLVASAAFQNEDVWAPWLEKQLVEIALRLPAGQPSQLFYKHIGELKKVLPLHLGIHSRAEAIASAAMYR